MKKENVILTVSGIIVVLGGYMIYKKLKSATNDSVPELATPPIVITPSPIPTGASTVAPMPVDVVSIKNVTNPSENNFYVDGKKYYTDNDKYYKEIPTQCIAYPCSNIKTEITKKEFELASLSRGIN